MYYVHWFKLDEVLQIENVFSPLERKSNKEYYFSTLEID